MATDIEKHYIQTFKNNVLMLSQQTESVTQGHCIVQPCSGAAANVADQFGTVKARRKTERHEDTKYSDTPRARRWLVPYETYTAELVDKSDILRLLTDPKSSLVRAHVAGMKRERDGAFLRAIFAAAATGEQPTSGTTALPSGNSIAANVEDGSNATGLSKTKLVKAVQAYIGRHVDVSAEVPRVLINAKAWGDIHEQLTFTNADYNDKKPLAGPVMREIDWAFCKLLVLDHEEFPVDTNEFVLPSWLPSGVTMGIWDDLEVSVQRHPTKVSSWEVKCTQSVSVTRIDEDKVQRIRIKNT